MGKFRKSIRAPLPEHGKVDVFLGRHPLGSRGRRLDINFAVLDFVVLMFGSGAGLKVGSRELEHGTSGPG